MDILFFAQTFKPATRGGVAGATYSLVQELIRLGHHVRVITSDRDGKEGKYRLNISSGSWTQYNNIPVCYCYTWPGIFLFSPEMASIAHKEAGKCDVMISGATAWDFPGLLADFLAKKHNLPHIIYPHGLFDPWVMQFKKYRKQIYWHLIAKYTLNRAAKIIALTKSEKEAIENLNIKAPIEVIPNGINSAEFTSVLTRKELDELYPSLKDKTFLIYMSRIHPKKGLDMLIPAFNSLLNDKKDDIKLVLAGQVDDSYTYAFNRLLLSNNKNNIITIGHVKGKLKNSLLKYASGFLLTSYSEGLPMAVLEAMSAGCPVIISNQCNLPEVKEYNAGIVVLNNVIEIKAAIIDILYNKESTITKIINAKKLIEEKFTWEMVGKKTDEIIRNIINP